MREKYEVPVRQFLAVLLCCTCAAPFGWTQESQSDVITPVRPKSAMIIRPYKAPFVPPAPLQNTGRLASLIRGGKLYLTAQDAIALALENNIDIEVARYTPILDAWNLERAEAGGALPGVPSGASQAGSVAKGEGVRGSQAAAGVTAGGSGGSGNGGGNATITQIGPVTPNLDPVFQDNTTFSHFSLPQANLSQALVTNLIDNTKNFTDSLQLGFLTGGQASITYSDSYLNENAPTTVVNPQSAPNLQISVQQNFLAGFGVAVNSRTINIAKMNLNIDDLNFKAEVITVVVNVLNLYYGLVANYEALRASQSSLAAAEQFYANNKKQVELGSMAPLDVTTAEAQVATSQQDLVTAETNVQTSELQLKNALSRDGNADPLLANAEIIPLDRIEVPDQDVLPPLKEMISQARKNRVSIAAEKLNLQVAQTNSLGTSNNVLPQLAGFASASDAGLSGASRPFCQATPQGQQCQTPDPSLVGGFGNALSQVFRRTYPTESGGVFFSARLRNRQNQADYSIDQLTIAQTKLQDAKDLNQIAVDVSNQVVALQQARARYQAAVKNRVLEQQLLDAEQKKFSLGASTPYNVVTQQRDFAAAQSSEVAALVAYSNARVALDETLGDTLEQNHVSIKEAMAGHIARASEIPATVPEHP